MNRGRKSKNQKPLQERVVEALYELCQIYLDREDISGGLRIGALIICVEQGTPLQVLNKRLEAGGITAPLEVYVGQKEGEVDIVTDEGVHSEKIEEDKDRGADMPQPAVPERS